MNRNSTSNAYLSFTRKERLGFICFSLLLAAIICIPHFFFSNKSSALKTDTTLLAAIDTLNTKNENEIASNEDDQNYYQPLKVVPFKKGELFAFDPNTITAAEWKRLGLNDRNIKTILNYRSKGGRFYKKDDLKKIWGLPEGFYDHVEDYIAINNPREVKQAEFVAYNEKKAPNKAMIDVNKADTSAFIALPGIGSKLASRIINFRDKLGGFYSVDQIAEVYGLPDSTFQKIKPFLSAVGSTKTININTATKDELKNHPYIKWNIANAIVEYRNMHGSFKVLEDLKKIAIIDEAVYKKIEKYLSL